KVYVSLLHVFFNLNLNAIPSLPSITPKSLTSISVEKSIFTMGLHKEDVSIETLAITIGSWLLNVFTIFSSLIKFTSLPHARIISFISGEEGLGGDLSSSFLRFLHFSL